MTYFDENGEYWGDKSKPIIDDGNGRLGARSVKIFADGMLFIHLLTPSFLSSCRCFEVRWCSSKCILQMMLCRHILFYFPYLSYMSHILIILDSMVL